MNNVNFSSAPNMIYPRLPKTIHAIAVAMPNDFVAMPHLHTSPLRYQKMHRRVVANQQEQRELWYIHVYQITV